jgi:hypothetical protein
MMKHGPLRRRYGRGVHRLADLMKQGFMKPRSKTKSVTPRPTVACDACLNWHPQGKHTATAAERKKNLAQVASWGLGERPVERAIE